MLRISYCCANADTASYCRADDDDASPDGHLRTDGHDGSNACADDIAGPYAKLQHGELMHSLGFRAR